LYDVAEELLDGHKATSPGLKVPGDVAASETVYLRSVAQLLGKL
jgi:hypothetical protein